MKVQVISNTAQKFNGETFYLCGYYFQRKGKRLHRAVWEYHNGRIPKGYHIHHKDGDRTNNDIENLALILPKEHLSGHMSTPERVKQSKKTIEIARAAACKWHGTEEGYAFHSKLAKENWQKREKHTYICSECGKEFTTKHIYGKEQNRFCNQNCRAKYRRKKRKEEEAQL